MKVEKVRSLNNRVNFGIVGYFVIILGTGFLLWGAENLQAGDPFEKPKDQEEAIEPQKGLAFDQVNWKRPQGVFSWITLARGYKVPWDSFGRQGWLTQDAYVEPVDPGVTEFSPDTPEIFVVFEGQPLDAPGQFAAAWYRMVDGKPVGDKPLGKDILELEMNQRYGYFILTPQNQKWDVGGYLVEVYYGSPGQELHDTNIVGTLKFSIKE